MPLDKVYLHEWSSYEDMVKDFSNRDYSPDAHWNATVPPENMPPPEDILLASYEQGGYEGSAFVVFKRDGKPWIVSAGHCSCYGLEDLWEPEETSVAALRQIVDAKKAQKDSYYFNDHYYDELEAVVKELENP